MGKKGEGGGSEEGVGQRSGSLPRPVLTASSPSQTIATIGPLFMSVGEVSRRKIDNWMERHTVDEVGEERLGRKVGICGVVSVLSHSQHGGRTRTVQCFSRCSLPGETSFRATSLKLVCGVSANENGIQVLGFLPASLEAGNDVANQPTLFHRN